MPKAVRILDRQLIFNQFIFRIEKIQLQHELFNGSMGHPITRLLLDRGDSVALLLHDLSAGEILLCEQFRLPTVDKGPGWLLEIPAGMVDHGEDEETSARREALEETGYSIDALTRIATVYVSPGGSSERIHIFYAKVSPGQRTGAGGGLQEEGEDIRLVRLPVAEVIDQARRGEIQDAKTLVALQWLALDSRATS